LKNRARIFSPGKRANKTAKIPCNRNGISARAEKQDTAIVHTTTPKTITENGVIRKRSPEWSDLKTMLQFLKTLFPSVDGENDAI